MEYVFKKWDGMWVKKRKEGRKDVRILFLTHTQERNIAYVKLCLIKLEVNSSTLYILLSPSHCSLGFNAPLENFLYCIFCFCFYFLINSKKFCWEEVITNPKRLVFHSELQDIRIEWIQTWPTFWLGKCFHPYLWQLGNFHFPGLINDVADFAFLFYFAVNYEITSLKVKTLTLLAA